MSRLRYNNQNGTLGGALTNSGTTITFSSAPNFATLTGTDYIPLFLDYGTATFEIVYLTAYTAAATTGTITRGAEDSTRWPAVAHNSGSGTWACASSIQDFVGGTVVRSSSASVGINEVTVVTAAAQTMTLPSAPPTTGTTNSITNNSSGVCTVARGGSDTISHYQTGSLTSLVLAPGMGVTLTYISGVWYVAPGTGFVPGMNVGTATFAPSNAGITITNATIVSGTIVQITAAGTWLVNQAVNITGASGGTWGTALNAPPVDWIVTTGGSGSFQINLALNSRAAPTGTYTASSGTVFPAGYSTGPATTLTSMDPTNLSLSFVVPPNGTVLLQADMDFVYTIYGTVFDIFVGWVTHNGSTQVGFPNSIQGEGGGTVTLGSHFTTRTTASGLTVGSTTLDLALGASTASYGSGYGQILPSAGATGGALGSDPVSPVLMTAYALP